MLEMPLSIRLSLMMFEFIFFGKTTQWCKSYFLRQFERIRFEFPSGKY